jgi:serine/threonine protein kinase
MKALEGLKHFAQLVAWYPLDPHHYVMVITHHANCDLITATHTDNYVIRKVMKQLLVGVSQLHELKISHRDLSTQNVLWDADQQELHIIDLESASFFHRYGFFHRTGHEGYDAPEKLDIMDRMGGLSSRHPRLSRKYMGYTEAADMYSVGVIFWMMLQQERDPPSPNTLQKWTRNALSQGKHKKYPELDLALQLLRRDPQHRITAQKALDHPFFQLEYPKIFYAQVQKSLRTLRREPPPVVAAVVTATDAKVESSSSETGTESESESETETETDRTSQSDSHSDLPSERKSDIVVADHAALDHAVADHVVRDFVAADQSESKTEPPHTDSAEESSESEETSESERSEKCGNVTRSSPTGPRHKPVRKRCRRSHREEALPVAELDPELMLAFADLSCSHPGPRVEHID